MLLSEGTVEEYVKRVKSGEKAEAESEEKQPKKVTTVTEEMFQKDVNKVMELLQENEISLDEKKVEKYYFYIRQINSLLCLYKDAAGIWHKDRFRPLVTALANLVMNLIMVQFWGLYGVLLSTVLSIFFVGMPWLYSNLFTVLFKFNPTKYILQTVLYTVISVVSCVICVVICNKFIVFDSLIATLIVRGVICCIIPNAIYLVCYRKTAEFTSSLALVNSLTKGKIKFLAKYAQ